MEERQIVSSVFKLDTLKFDLQSANFNRTNDTFRRGMLSFQSPFEANEISINCKATCFKQKAYHNKKRRKLKTFLI